jgi:hypothetical protein
MSLLSYSPSPPEDEVLPHYVSRLTFPSANLNLPRLLYFERDGLLLCYKITFELPTWLLVVAEDKDPFRGHSVQ